MMLGRRCVDKKEALRRVETVFKEDTRGKVIDTRPNRTVLLGEFVRYFGCSVGIRLDSGIEATANYHAGYLPD
jgi:hypothetical protein